MVISVPAKPKPQKSTPESRRQRREQVRQIKKQFRPELFRERIRDQEQTPVVKADPGEANDFRVQGSSLRSISPKRLAAIKGRQIHSTIGRKQGSRPLLWVRKIDGHKVRAVQQKPMMRGKPLKVLGKRGKRLAPKDAAARKEIAGLPCVCGCNRPTVWVHLRTRSDEKNRHKPEATVPGCLDLDSWLDQGPGSGLKRGLFRRALKVKRRLVHSDIYKTLSEHGFYTWLHDRRIP